jgi:murein L,D-transpeptidase YafK
MKKFELLLATLLMTMKVSRLIVYFLFFFISCNAREKPLLNYDCELSEIFEMQHINRDDISVLIDKSDYTLRIMADTLIIKEFPVVFGKNPEDDKLRQGDRCTPEGTFTIITKYPHKSWSKFIWLNYPNEESWKKHNDALQAGIIPANSQIGGQVGIHGVPEGMDMAIDLKMNWTMGCIAMKNKDVNEIYPYITETTKIVIRK